MNEEGFLIINSGFKSIDQRNQVESVLVKLFPHVFRIGSDETQNLVYLLEKKAPQWVTNWEKYTKISLDHLIKENIITDIDGEESIYKDLSITSVTNSKQS